MFIFFGILKMLPMQISLIRKLLANKESFTDELLYSTATLASQSTLLQALDVVTEQNINKINENLYQIEQIAIIPTLPYCSSCCKCDICLCHHLLAIIIVENIKEFKEKINQKQANQETIKKLLLSS